MNTELFKPTYLRALCEEFHLTPSKEYGQNYLLNAGVIEKMVRAAKVQKGECVVEVGPGFGVLTFGLLDAGVQVTAFEIEKKLIAYWKPFEQENKHLKIVWGNILYQFEEAQKTFPKKYIVAANVPYQITSLLMRLFLEAKKKPERMVVMVQKEVATRICAKPGDMSLLAVSVQYYGKPSLVASVAKGNFWPTPKVDSAVLLIDEIQDRPNAEAFFRLVRSGFASKRKQVWRNIAEGLQLPAEAVKKSLIDRMGSDKVRAEELSITDWEYLVEKLF